MPVILENGSDQIRTWLDPNRSEWSKDLQSLLKPYNGELDCYPVDQAVGKVGNNSPSFIVPVASTENKKNIANFFGNAKKAAKAPEEKKRINQEETEAKEKGNKVEQETDESRATLEQSSTEDNAPLPIPTSATSVPGSKRGHEEVSTQDEGSPKHKSSKIEEVKEPSKIEQKSTETPKRASGRKIRSATSNGTKGSPVKVGDGSQRITNFFNK